MDYVQCHLVCMAQEDCNLAEDNMKRSISEEVLDNSLNEEQERPKRARLHEATAPPAENDSMSSPGSSHDTSISPSAADRWRNMNFAVNSLKGHSDLVSSLALDGDLLVSASHDTTLKVWNVGRLEEVCSLRGHTGQVTSVTLLSAAASTGLSETLNVPAERLALSGSTDCCIKVWQVLQGQLVKSVYTFNGITHVGYLPDEKLAISGTDGGKLELFDLEKSLTVDSVKAYDHSVCAMKISGGIVVTSCSKGQLKMLCVRNRKLQCLKCFTGFTSDRQLPVTVRKVRCIEVHGGKILVGDQHRNLKIVCWNSGRVKKLRNHLGKVGVTDAVCVSKDLLLTSSYDPDTCLGSVNIRHIPSERYQCTVSDEDTGRILSLAATKSLETVKFITGGEELKVWVLLQCPFNRKELQRRNSNVVSANYNESYMEDVEDSTESDTDSDDEEEEDYHHASSSERNEQTVDTPDKSRCSLS